MIRRRETFFLLAENNSWLTTSRVFPMFADPQSVTINAVAQALPRTAVGPNGPESAQYTKDDGNVALLISHQKGKRIRRTARLDFSKIAADPLISSTSIKYSMSAYLVVDLPPTGFTVVEAKQIVDGLTAWLTASTGANVTRLLANES